MDVLIVGAGAIGSLLGGRLAAAGHTVTLVGRQRYVDAVSARGLGIEENGAVTYIATIRAVTDPAQVGGDRFDLLILTTKAYDTVEAVASVAERVRRGTPLLLVQNGVGGESLAQSVVGDAPLFSAVVTLAVEVPEAGVIRPTTSSGGLGLAAVVEAEGGLTVDALAETFRAAGFKTSVYADYRAMKWSKLLLNILGNAGPAILGLSPGVVFGDPRLFALERDAFCEARAVMRRLGLKPVNLPGYPVSALAWVICSLPAGLLRPVFRRVIVRGRGGKMPSLYLDLERGRRKSEVEFLNGAVVRQAQELGMEVPANRRLYETLTAIVSGAEDWSRYRGRPETLAGGER